MSVLYLSEDDVLHVLTMEMALDAVEEALRRLAFEEAENIPRSRCRTDHVMLHVLPAAAKTFGAIGFKAYTTTKNESRFLVAVYDGKTGALSALLQGDHLGRIRTGAASGVATQYMARADATTCGIFGSGRQARTQLLAISRVRKLKRVNVYSPNEKNRRAFAEEMSRLCDVEVVPVARPQEAAEKLDIVVTATAAREPVLFGSWLAEGTHVNAIGSNFLAKAEVDVATFRRAKTVIVDSKDQARIEAGDFTAALEDGALRWSHIHELGQVVVGRYRGRDQAQDVTLFKSLGMGLEDIAVAARAVAAAQSAGLGRIIDL